MTELEEFQQLVDNEWEFRVQFDPLFATLCGDNRFNDRLPHVAPENYASHINQLKDFRQRFSQIDRAALSDGEQINFDIFRRLLEDAILEDEFGAYYLPISKAGGFHLEFPELFQFVPLTNVYDYENYISRLAGFRHMAGEYIELMRAGLQNGFTPVRSTLEGIENALQTQIISVAEESPLYQPFQGFPENIDDANQQRLRQLGSEAILDSVVPGYQDLFHFIIDEYIPAARLTPGAADLPNGEDFYTHRIRMFTSLDLNPKAIHETGIEEVNRIRAEMQEMIDTTGFPGEFKEFIAFLRKDPRFYARSGEELLMYTALVLKRMDGELPGLFKTLPRMPYGIRAIPDHSAPGNTTAYYFPPAGDDSRAGTYYVNLYDLPSRPLYEIEALSLHEAVPGHHLQIALQQELGELPMFRRFGGFTAFVEGWALYAERLGLEVGFYQDPYSNFGRLSYEMWRACRLVVDTGMHALGWTRQQAIDFMAANTSLTLLNITNEVDRYIAWPGQALAYKIGELKIRQLRSRAEEKLGARFDLREFHDLILGSGAVPLDILENMVDHWIDNSI